MTTKEAARRSCNYDTRLKLSTNSRDNSIITDYERGALIAGLIIAITFGLMFVHAAVVL